MPDLLSLSMNVAAFTVSLVLLMVLGVAGRPNPALTRTLLMASFFIIIMNLACGLDDIIRLHQQFRGWLGIGIALQRAGEDLPGVGDQAGVGGDGVVAIGQGAIDGGISGVYAYPGTPSTEITEYIQINPDAISRSPASGGAADPELSMIAIEVSRIEYWDRKAGRMQQL